MAARVSAKAIIVNSDGKFLILTNSYMAVKPYLAYAPDFPGGTIEQGETAEQALIREVKEELGIDITDAPRQAVAQCGSRFAGFKVSMYMVWANVRDVNLGEEHCMFSWLTAEQMQRLPWWNGYRKLFVNIETYAAAADNVEFAEYTKAISYA